MTPYSDERHSVLVAIIGTSLVVLALIYAFYAHAETTIKANTLLIQSAIERQVDLASMRCLLNPMLSGCDTVQLIKQVQSNPRLAELYHQPKAPVTVVPLPEVPQP